MQPTIGRSFLNTRQREIADLILSGRNVFLTGVAGTGKSYLFKYVIPGTWWIKLPSGHGLSTFTDYTLQQVTSANSCDIDVTSTGGSINMSATEAANDAITLTASSGGLIAKVADERTLQLSNTAADTYFKINASATAANETVQLVNAVGTDNAAMEYLMTFNPMAVGSDTWGVDNVPPSKGDKVFYGHVTALQNNGVYLLEVMDTGGLVKEGVNEFMFVLGQARVEGTVQMIINPVAIW